MKIEAGHSTYELPEHIADWTAELAMWSNGDPEQHPGSFMIAVYRVQWHEFLKRQEAYKDVQAQPVMWAVACDGKTLHVIPTPAVDTWFKFRYCPAMKVL